jgi:hypothetical protein
MKGNAAVHETVLDKWVFHTGDRAWIIVVTALLTNSVLRGLRAPNMWGCTHLLLNYDFGLAKRALQGAILSVLAVPNLYSYDFCFWYSATFLAVNIALLCGLLWRLCTLQDATARLMACVFASSLAVVMLNNSVGYPDHTGLLVTLLLLIIKNFYVRAMVAIVLFSAIILIYEGQLAIFFPLILFRFLLDMGSPIRQGRVVALSVLCICVLTMSVWVGTLQMSEASATALYESLQARTEYQLGRDIIYILTTANTDRVNDVSEYWLSPRFIRFAVSIWIVTLPTIAYLVHGTLVNLAHLGRSRAVQGMAVIASLSPLSLHVVGFDYNRWTTLAITTSLLVFSVTTMRFCTQVDTFPSLTRRRVIAAIVLIGLNLGSTIHLYNGYIVDNFPYPRFVQNMIDIIARKSSFPPEPPKPCVTSEGYVCRTIITEEGAPKEMTLEELRNLSPSNWNSR